MVELLAAHAINYVVVRVYFGLSNYEELTLALFILLHYPVYI